MTRSSRRLRTSTTLDTSRPDTRYALDSAWHAERDRLDGITRLYDPGTLEICEGLGVSGGWHCLDVGAGTGTLAQFTLPARRTFGNRHRARRRHPLPESARIRAPAGRGGRHHQGAPPADRFDFVHARLLLEHLVERETVLAAMVQATKPGGWVLIEDFDWATALVIDPPSPTQEKGATAIMDLFVSHGYAPTYGRTLLRRLEAAGLIDIGTRAQSIQVRADRLHGLPQWELLADQLAPGLRASGLVTDEDLERFHALWHDGETVCFSPLMVSCWGRRQWHA